MQKTKQPYKDIDDYTETFPPEVQEKLGQIRALVKKIAPEAVEVISYGIPTFDLNGKHLMHYAAYKSHVAIYPFPTGIAQFKDEAEQHGYKTSTGTIQFPLNKPLPMEFIHRIIEFRLLDNPQRYGRS
jgi:uncharacterized protein YdhG (YjbR/CyaY superfamily)